MGLTAWFREVAFSRPHLLVVAAPGAIETRIAVERYAREQGWPLAESPADTDVLVVLGTVTEDLQAVVSVLESEIPAPRIRVDLQQPEQVSQELSGVAVRLASESRRSSRDNAGPAEADNDGQAMATSGDHGTTGHGDHDTAEHEMPGQRDHGMAGHGDHDTAGHGDHDTAGHGDHDTATRGDHDMAGHRGHGMTGHDGHEMAARGGHDMPGHGGHDMAGHHEHMGPVAGLPMASRAPDRDGLKLDVLHVPLGPVLPYWPAGLRLSLTVQGDVVQEAAVELLGIADAGPSFWDEPVLRVLAGEPVQEGQVARRRAAAHLDSLVRLLGVAGWDAPTLASAALRDRVLDGEPSGPLRQDFGRLRRRVLRSRRLRWMASGLGVLDVTIVNRLGVSGPAGIAAGDVLARVGQWLRAVADDLTRVDDGSPAADLDGPRGRLDGGQPPSVALLEALPALVVGAELAGVRLIVASLDPDLAELRRVHEVVAHG